MSGEEQVERFEPVRNFLCVVQAIDAEAQDLGVQSEPSSKPLLLNSDRPIVADRLNAIVVHANRGRRDRGDPVAGGARRPPGPAPPQPRPRVPALPEPPSRNCGGHARAETRADRWRGAPTGFRDATGRSEDDPGMATEYARTEPSGRRVAACAALRRPVPDGSPG